MVLFVVGAALAAQARAQDSKSARGTVTAVTGDSITVKAADGELKFAVDPKTVLTAPGAGTAERKADAAGKPGTRAADFVKVGDAVEVTYQSTGGAMHASRIRRVSSPGSGGGSTAGERADTSSGKVDSLSGSTLAISGSSGGGGALSSRSPSMRPPGSSRPARVPPPPARAARSCSPISSASEIR